MPHPNLKSYLFAAYTKIRGWFVSGIIPLSTKLKNFCTSWWKIMLLIFSGFFILYYGLGGWSVNKIDTDTDYEINTPANQSATIEIMSFLINREVRENMWTPNLPFVFPSYFLDNMPNFQLGLFSALQNTSKAMARRLDKTVASSDDRPLKTAAEYLSYPGTIWMFSPQNKLVPVPSAGSQYRKARKQLINYNQSLRDGSDVFYKSPQDLAYILQQIAKDLWRSSGVLEEHIQEHSSDWFDFQSDNLFYHQQGKLYGYYLLIKALCFDYKNIIVASDVYAPLTNMLKALENAAHLSPTIVYNGTIASSANSLLALNYYTVKADVIAESIIKRLLETNPIPPQGHADDY